MARTGSPLFKVPLNFWIRLLWCSKKASYCLQTFCVSMRRYRQPKKTFRFSGLLKKKKGIFLYVGLKCCAVCALSFKGSFATRRGEDTSVIDNDQVCKEEIKRCLLSQC